MSRFLREYRIKTPAEAFIKQLFFSFLLSLCLSSLYFLSIDIAMLTLFALVGIPSYLNIRSIPMLFGKKKATPMPQDNSDTPVYEDTTPKGKPGFLERITSAAFFPAILTAFISVVFSGLITIAVFYMSPAQSVFALIIVDTGFIFTLFGFALAWIEKKEIDEFSESKKDRVMLCFFKYFAASKGFYFMGTADGKKVGLPRMQRFLHSMISGPTGEFKTSSFITPALLFDADSIGSAVVPDAKSPELFSLVAGRWLKKFKKVYLFDPWHPDTIGIELLRDMDDMELAMLDDALIKERQEAIKKEEEFFKSRTRYLLFGIFKLVQTFKDEYCNLATVYRVVQSVGVLEKFIKAADSNVAALFSDYSDQMTKSEKMNALTSIREKLDIFAYEDVRKAFSKPEFKLEMLFREKEPCLLIIGAPSDKQEPGSKIASLLVNLIINMAFKERRLQKQAQQKGEKSFVPNDLYLYLDELRSLKVTDLPRLLSIARDIKTQVLGCVTDLGFFNYYKEDFSSLMGNFRTRIVTRGLDNFSTKYFSDALWDKKVNSYGIMRGGSIVRQDKQKVLTPSDIYNLPNGKTLVFTPKAQARVIDHVSINTTPWLKKMIFPAPIDMRALYREWGISTGDLSDPVLPMISGFYDMAKIKSGRAVNVDQTLTVEKFNEKFKEMGGGGFRSLAPDAPSDAEVLQDSTEEAAPNDDDIIFNG